MFRFRRTPKIDEVESQDYLMRRIGDALKYLPVDQLALSP